MYPLTALRGFVLLTVSLAAAVRCQERTHASLTDANLTQLLSRPVLPAYNAPPWSRESYGLTTFAAAPPLRCFGVDAETPYDVAVLGVCHHIPRPHSFHYTVDHLLDRRSFRYYHQLPAGVSSDVLRDSVDRERTLNIPQSSLWSEWHSARLASHSCL